MEPAILTERPAFGNFVSWVRPTLPPLREIARRLEDAFARGQLTNDGPYVRQFEAELSEYLGVHCACVSSGTMGLYLAAQILAPGGRVMIPAYTFTATAMAYQMAHAKSVLGDILADTLCLDAGEVRLGVAGGRIDCISPVNVYGSPPDVDAFTTAAPQGCPILFDSAHGLGSRYGGRRVGGFGTAEVFSLHSTKILPCGEGGVVTSRDGAFIKEVAARRNFGLSAGVSTTAGTNAKMQEFSAILGLWGLARLEGWIQQREELVARYRARLQLPGLRFQQVDARARSNHVNFAVLVGDEFGLSRDELAQALSCELIGSRPYFSPDLTRHPGVEAEQRGSELVTARRISDQVLCLPLASHQSVAEVDLICDCICTVYEHRKAVTSALRRSRSAPAMDLKG